MILYPERDRYRVVQYNSKGHRRFETGYQPDQELVIYRSGSVISGDSFSIIDVAGRGFQGLYALDIRGRGADDFVKVNYALHYEAGSNGFGRYTPKITLTTYDQNLDGTSRDYPVDGSFYEGDYCSPSPRMFLWGDFDGTGRIKLLAISGSKLPDGREVVSFGTLLDPGSKDPAYNFVSVVPIDVFKNSIFTTDYDGDGKMDICVLTKAGTTVYSYSNGNLKMIAHINEINSSEKISISQFGGSQALKTEKQLLIGDFNGDGKSDFLVIPRTKYSEYKIEHSGKCNWCCHEEGNITYDSREGDGLGPEPRSYTLQYDCKKNGITTDFCIIKFIGIGV